MKIIISIITMLLITGCESNEETLEAYENNKSIKCQKELSLFNYTVLTNASYTYESNLEVFVNKNDQGDVFPMSGCISRK